jgi:aldehyde dehydrogenase (NAD+)
MNVTTRIAPDIPATFATQQQTALRLRTSTAPERIAKLKKLESAILAAQETIRQALQADLRKPATESDLTEIMPVIAEIRHAVRHLRRWMRPRRVLPTATMFGTAASIRPEPRGVSLIISPWNYPIGLTLGPLAAAIAAGCTAICKPSELTPACSALLSDLIRATFDPAEIALFEGDATLSTTLLDLPFDHIFFTGSPAVGKIVMAAAARHLSSVTLELGGKSPVIVDATADVAKAAKTIMWGKFLNNGQTCIAPDYLFVHEAVLPEFIEKSQAAITQMYGDARTSKDYGRLVNDRHFSRVQHLLEDAITNGAKIATGGTTDAAEKFIAPTLLTNVTATSAIMREEIFGPLLPILPYTDLSAPISHINASPKPLALYIFSKDDQTVERILTATSAGGTAINTTVLHFSHPNLPFGGVNNSGIGAAHGVYGFRAFSHERAILRDKFSTTAWLFPPYTQRLRRLVQLTLKYLT